MKRKINVYIDGSNIYFAQNKLEWSINWRKCIKIIGKKRKIGKLKYYIAIKKDEEKTKKYVKFLNKIGFQVVTKPLKKIKLEENKSIYSKYSYVYKANFDVEITTDILLDRKEVREIVIFSGDSDFAYLVRKLIAEGIKVLIISSKETLSWELRLAASEAIYLERLEKKISRKKYPPRNPDSGRSVNC